MATDSRSAGLGTGENRSDMDPVKVPPGSKADPSAEPAWTSHVKEYFSGDATHGEAVPTASHEAKEQSRERPDDTIRRP